MDSGSIALCGRLLSWPGPYACGDYIVAHCVQLVMYNYCNFLSRLHAKCYETGSRCMCEPFCRGPGPGMPFWK
jgi:hypothetical protein